MSSSAGTSRSIRRRNDRNSSWRCRFRHCPEHLPSGDVQRGEQRRRAVPDVVVGVAFGVAEAHRQRRLGAIERLDLRLLVHAQDHRVVGRAEAQPDDVAHFLDEERIGGQLEGLRQMRLDPEEGEPTLVPCSWQCPQLAPGACAPMRGGVGRLLQGTADHHRRHFLVVIGPGTTGAEFVVQALDAGRSEAPSPLADGLWCYAEAPRDGRVGQAFGTGEDHPGSLDQGVGQGGRGRRGARPPKRRMVIAAVGAGGSRRTTLAGAGAECGHYLGQRGDGLVAEHGEDRIGGHRSAKGQAGPVQFTRELCTEYLTATRPSL